MKASAALLRMTHARMVDDPPAHRACGVGYEVRTVGKGGRIALTQIQTHGGAWLR